MKTELELITEQNETTPPEFRILTKGMVIADHTILRCKRLTERIVGDSYATWITLCESNDKKSYHRWVTWVVVAREDGFRAEAGSYYPATDWERAVGSYDKRGGW